MNIAAREWVSPLERARAWHLAGSAVSPHAESVKHSQTFLAEIDRLDDLVAQRTKERNDARARVKELDKLNVRYAQELEKLHSDRLTYLARAERRSAR